MSVSFFLPVAWAPGSERRLLPNPESAFYGGPKEFHPFCRRASRAIKSEIVAVVPKRAERTPVPGAGFSPEAVPGNELEKNDTRNRQPRHSVLKSYNERLTPKTNRKLK
jgi:hypothetical protein